MDKQDNPGGEIQIDQWVLDTYTLYTKDTTVLYPFGRENSCIRHLSQAKEMFHMQNWHSWWSMERKDHDKFDLYYLPSPIPVLSHDWSDPIYFLTSSWNPQSRSVRMCFVTKQHLSAHACNSRGATSLYFTLIQWAWLCEMISPEKCIFHLRQTLVSTLIPHLYIAVQHYTSLHPRSTNKSR